MARPIVHHLDGQALFERWVAGATLAQLARELEVDRSTVRRAIREGGTRQEGNVLQLPLTAHGQVIPPGQVSSTELIQRANITYRQLDYWTRVGLLVPANGVNKGSGYERLWTAAEVSVAALMSRLIYAGVEVRAAHDVARSLLETGRATLAGFPIELAQEA